MTGLKHLFQGVKKYELKTEAGKVNLSFGLALAVLFGGVEIFSFLKVLVYKFLYPGITPSLDIFKFFILVIIFFIISILIIFITEKWTLEFRSKKS